MEIRAATVLVTGANGFVGSRLARRLSAAGACVRGLVRKPGLGAEITAAGGEEIVGDFTDRAIATRAASGADVVLHCAATVGPDLETARAINAAGTHAMLDAARAGGAARFLQISTVAVYDLVSNPPIVDEAAPLKTEGDPYGVTKAAADRAVLEATRGGLAATILRPTAILGWHPTSTWAVKIPSRVREGTLPLLADGRNTWSWVHAENLADAVLLALREDAAAGGVYNVVDGHSTWLAYTDDVRRWFDAPPLPTRAREALAPGQYWTGRFANERLQRELGWKPRLTYADGMAEAERYWRGR